MITDLSNRYFFVPNHRSNMSLLLKIWFLLKFKFIINITLYEMISLLINTLSLTFLLKLYFVYYLYLHFPNKTREEDMKQGKWIMILMGQAVWNRKQHHASFYWTTISRRRPTIFTAPVQRRYRFLIGGKMNWFYLLYADFLT